jgi:hypothetical protein
MRGMRWKSFEVCGERILYSSHTSDGVRVQQFRDGKWVTTHVSDWWALGVIAKAVTITNYGGDTRKMVDDLRGALSDALYAMVVLRKDELI